MKLSVSLPDDDVDFIDDFGKRAGMDSRSAVLQAAVTMLRSAELASQYEEAFAEWAQSGDAQLWDSALSDGISG